MNSQNGDGTTIADRFDGVEALLRRYPDIDAAELEQLRRWFRKEASAFEVASLASKADLYPAYSAFRAEHIDRFRPVDWGIAFFALMAFVGAVIALLAMK